jgi:predicted phage baseplate assembly protein
VALPAPNLDDRRFQDLVDEAKLLVQRRCPEWSDHNVSDPGITLIETFAYLVDQLLYRVNRIPGLAYIKFLELIGLHLFPPTAARVDVTFWLSAPHEETLPISQGTEVATLRTVREEATQFTTTEDLAIVPCHRTLVVATTEATGPVDRTEDVDRGRSFACFSTNPVAGDALYVGLSNPVPSCAVVLRMSCRTEGVGVDPRNPPIAWEALGSAGWLRCEVDHDDTGGFNEAGDVVLHVPKGHASGVLPQLRLRASWLRCRVTPSEEGQPRYRESPQVSRVDAFTIGGTVSAVHASVVEDEIIGISQQVPAQRFTLNQRPVVPSETPIVLEVSGDEGWKTWEQVENFAASQADSRHFVLDHAAGEIVLGPAVREPDGSLRQYGATPTKGATLRVRTYRTGGGRQGNVATRAITVLKSSIPYVTRVENRRAAAGGVDGETLEAAKLRGPILLRTRDRAVTKEDYEHLARQAAPEVARVRCVVASEGADAGGVRILVVPAVPADETGKRPFEQLVPGQATLEAIRASLDATRAIGSRLSIEPPYYTGVTVAARVHARPRVDSARLRAEALRALYHYFDPLTGGPEGDGWPFGRPVQAGEAYGVLQRVAGVEFIEEIRLFGADPLTGARTEEVPRIELDPHALIYSYDHQVRVIEA